MKKDQIQGMEKEKRQQMIKEGRNGMEYNKIQRMEKGRGIDRQIQKRWCAEKSCKYTLLRNIPDILLAANVEIQA